MFVLLCTQMWLRGHKLVALSCAQWKMSLTGKSPLVIRCCSFQLQCCCNQLQLHFNFFLILLSLWMWWYHVVTRLGKWRGQRRIRCMSAIAVKTSQQLEEKRAVHEGMSLGLTSCYDFPWACRCDLCQDVLRSLQCSVKSLATNDVLHFPEATEYLCLKSLKTSIFQLAKHFVTENLL